MTRKPFNIHMNTWIFVLSIFFEKLSNISYNKWSWAHRNKKIWYDMTDLYIYIYISICMSIYLIYIYICICIYICIYIYIYLHIYIYIILAKSLRNGSNKKYIFKILTRRKQWFVTTSFVTTSITFQVRSNNITNYFYRNIRFSY